MGFFCVFCMFLFFTPAVDKNRRGLNRNVERESWGSSSLNQTILKVGLWFKL